jgi:PAS domain S-box-containing protein
MQEPVDKWLPRKVLAGVLILSASPLLIVEIFPSQLKFVMEPASYIVFHNIAEFFSIMVSLSMFGVGWYTYEQSKNRHALFLSAAFLAIGLMDFMHTMSMPAMPDFITSNEPQKSVQFWIPARLFQAAAFLASAYIYPDKPIRWLSKRILILSSLLVASLVFIGNIFFQTHMPTFFVFGVGVTPLKKFCEYLVIFLLCAATAAYWRRMEKTGDRLLIYYLAAFVVSIFSELPLAFYARSFDTYNVLGHINKVIAFFLIYYGIYRASVKGPYIRLAETAEKLRLQAGQYTTMLATSSDGFWLVGRNGRLLDVNENYCRMSGYSRAELLNLFVTDIEACETPEEIAGHIRKVMEAGFDRFETKHRMRNGEILDVEASVSFWREAGQLFLFVRDITDRKQAQAELKKYHQQLEELVKERTSQLEFANAQLRAEVAERKRTEEALRQSEKRYRSLFDGMTEGFALHEIICDERGVPRDYRFLEINPAFERFTGLKRADVVNRTMNEVLPGEDPEWVKIYGEVALTGKSVHFDNYSPILKKHYEVFAFCPAPHQFGVLFLDITERKQVEEALRQRTAELQQLAENLEDRVHERTEELGRSTEALRQLSSKLLSAQEKERKRIAAELHDSLLSELAAMKFLFEAKLVLLKKGQLTDTNEFDRIRDIMQKVMKDTRAIMNNLRPSILDEMGLISTIDWFSREYQKAYAHIQIRTQLEVLEKDIPDILRVVIFRVLQEALNNFAKHGRGNLVELSLLKSGDALQLRIQDNGQGFDVGNVQKGLGLESMQERVELSGGEFQIESARGAGTTIRASWLLPDKR